ncbi:dihydrofolate reductase family protein [Leifsonia sp. NPDC058230]|uniref:dihydrofolate reductase family protein n=1 Tax=Leifsonia sp. NPDC058230 TaxID=3346391 RepID=UPI0036D9F7C6
MRRLIATEWVTLDGVVQAPSYPDEDISGGFEHGGWHARYLEDASLGRVVESVTKAGAYLFGRGTYDVFAAHWPSASAEEKVLAEPLNTRPKFVVSRTLGEPLDWVNTTLIAGDVATAVADLKDQDGQDILIIGSPGLFQTLLRLELIDELRLMIDPVVVGGGKRLFADDEFLHSFRLIECEPTSTGAILATYGR